MWVATFVLMGRAFALYGILGHEAAHRLLFSKRWANDGIGRWGLSYPGFVPFDVYRRSHFAHHKDEMGPEEPDVNLYAHYPITRDSLARKLRRDAVGISGWKNLKGLFRGLQFERTRGVALRILGTQVAILGIFTAFGRPELYPLLWLAPWMTVWRVINRLRAIAEHGGMIRSGDRRRDHPPRAAELGRPLLDRPLQHRLAPGPPRRHGRAVPPPPPLPRRAGRRRLGRARPRVPQLPHPLEALPLSFWRLIRVL